MSVSSIKSGGSGQVPQIHIIRGFKGLSHLFISPSNEKVDFQFLHQVRYDVLQDLLNTLPKDYKNHKLLRINLNGKRITDRDLVKILSTDYQDRSSRFSNLLELNLSGCRNLTTLAPLRYVPQLRQLSISHFSNWSPAEYEIFQHLGQLEELDLSHSETLSDDGLARILSHCPHLKTLHLNGCKKLTGEAVASIAKLTHLEHLDLSGCAVSHGALSHLENHPTLSTLHLRHCSLTDFDLEHIRKIPNLRDLDLSGNFIIRIDRLGNLTSLKIADCLCISNLIELGTYGNLRTLDLSGLTIGPVLSEIAPFLSEIRSLSLSNCQLKAEDCWNLLFFSHLHFLDLSRNPQVDDQVIRHYLRKLPLTSLDVSDCKIELEFEKIKVYCKQLDHLKLYKYWRSFYYPPPEPPKVQEHPVITYIKDKMRKPLVQRVAAAVGVVFVTLLYL